MPDRRRGITGAAMIEEQRKSPRIPTRLPVHYGLYETDRTDYAFNISEKGLCIRTNKVLKVGTRIRLQIEFPERSVFFIGEVMWAIKVPEHLIDSMVCGMGVRFLNPEPGWGDYYRGWRRSMDALAS